MRRSVIAPHRLILLLILLAVSVVTSSAPVGSQAGLVDALSGGKIPGDVELIRNVEYGKGGDKALMLDIVRPKVQPKDPMPVIIFIHGGGWRNGSKERGVQHLIPFAQKGYFCATINYRLTDEAIWPAQIEDCKCAVRWMRAHAKKYNADPDRIGVWGSSAGGHLVAMLGTSGGIRTLEGKGGWEKESSRVQAVCDYFGPTDFMKLIEDARKSGALIENLRKIQAGGAVSKLLGGPFWEKEGLCRQSSPITYVSKDDPPFLICHGDKDNLVPLSQSEVFYEALKKEGVETTLKILEGAGHGFSPKFDAEKYVIEFFGKHLQRSK